MSQPADSRKWGCEYCTFENWPQARRCTMCHASRPPRIIQDEAPLGSSSPSDGTGSKWPCQVCTFLNWPKASRCTQCLSMRPKAIPLISPPTATQPLSINVHIEQPSLCSAARKLSPRTSPGSPESSKALNNDKNRVMAAATRNKAKWTCKLCTYDNWPKSFKCIICGVPRGKTQHEASAIMSTSGSGSDTELRQLSPSSSESGSKLLGATASPSPIPLDSNVRHKDKKLRQIRKRLREVDWLWLNACQGVVDGDINAMEAYLASGGDPSRSLTAEECTVLNRASAFQAGYSLIHLAVRFQREDMLAALLTSSDVSKAKKRVPSHAAPDVAAELLRDVASFIRKRKGDFPCYFLTENATFALPAEINDLPNPLKKQLFDELLDQDVQKELEDEEPIINWSLELTDRLGSRLYALWNRTAGDCLLDSVLQASWGIMDRDNTLRRCLADSLCEGTCLFFPRWKECESIEALSLHFSLEDNQWHKDWAILLSLASQPGSSLEQIHVFALAHILRRPIVIYGIKYVKSFRGENIGLAKFQGVYLPLLWEQSFCWKTPLALGYTRGHFCALVPMETDAYDRQGAGAKVQHPNECQTAYLPLTDCHGKLLPIHFLPSSESGREEVLLREWLDCEVTEGGLLVARQCLSKPSIPVRQMLDDWLERFRRLAHVMQAATPAVSSPSPHRSPTHELSSDDETDDE
ncbi:hypothetical protein CAPTEDRAFT_178164 [Capitella teleta]|uniref:ubiquitinyl hydrolase 1 n=1 Tax=Capitella teleta TaxID=283909 RepID=R7ULE4_CAPTE|nr:hypothetical protein CAPTEDRAFT_178164 [Capitella teleta]|eukprot:ELU04077.1 hypothetical protein CAPTEDRAFT_178164 [Capitella teleta]